MLGAFDRIASARRDREVNITTYGYVRTPAHRSPQPSEERGVQRRVIHEYAELRGLGPPIILTERSTSGSWPLQERPEGKRLLGLLQDGDAVIASGFERVFGSAIDAIASLEVLRRMGVRLHLCDLGGDIVETGIERLLTIVLSAVSDGEQERVRERIRTGGDGSRSTASHRGGRPPLGCKIDETGRLVKLPEREAMINRIKVLRRQGDSYKQIATKMTQEGQRISSTTVWYILKEESIAV